MFNIPGWQGVEVPVLFIGASPSTNNGLACEAASNIFLATSDHKDPFIFSVHGD